MNKKAISTLTATVLVIGFTIVLAGVVYTFILPLVNNPTSNETLNVTIPEQSHKSFCDFNFFKIIYVDKLLTDNCYATKNNPKIFYKLHLEDSFKYQYMLSDTSNCYNFRTLGEALCLKDNSTCLILEDNNKICNIINLSEVSQ